MACHFTTNSTDTVAGKPIIAITAGDVAGIGPEIIARALSGVRVREVCQPLVICHPDILKQAMELCGQSPAVVQGLERLPDGRDQLSALLQRTDRMVLCLNPAGDDALNAPVRTVSPDAGQAAFQYLTAAIDLCRSGTVDAIATAPLNKAALHASGHNYPGHTEILAQQCGVENFAMMLHLPESRMAALRRLISTSDVSPSAGHGVSIAHVTLHTSLRSVPDMLTVEGISENIRLMDDFLAEIGCRRRAVAVCALNPHGGESGLFGTEETKIITPALQEAIADGRNVSGPLPVDTLIRRAFCGEFDGIVAMYHDQGHIPVKLIGFDAAVNITLGLPIVRTSPTHGTAFDRAWDRATPADACGMTEAILTAVTLCRGHGVAEPS